MMNRKAWDQNTTDSEERNSEPEKLRGISLILNNEIEQKMEKRTDASYRGGVVFYFAHRVCVCFNFDAA